jgi:hypothetical protein
VSRRLYPLMMVWAVLQSFWPASRSASCRQWRSFFLRLLLSLAINQNIFKYVWSHGKLTNINVDTKWDYDSHFINVRQNNSGHVLINARHNPDIETRVSKINISSFLIHVTLILVAISFVPQITITCTRYLNYYLKSCRYNVTENT